MPDKAMHTRFLLESFLRSNTNQLIIISPSRKGWGFLFYDNLIPSIALTILSLASF